MKIPKKHTTYLTFLHMNEWYVITAVPTDRNVYHLYRLISGTEVEFLGTGNSPTKLEDRVYSGKYSVQNKQHTVTELF